MIRRSIVCAMGPVVALAATSSAGAENADYYSGGWRTETGDPQVYQVVIRGNRVSGIACTQCADGTTLARIEGTFDEATGLAFTVRHLTPSGALASQDQVRARYAKGKLLVSGTRGGPGGRAFEQVVIKDPRGPAAGFFPIMRLPPGTPPVPALPAATGGGGPRPAPPPYEPPAPWRQLSSDDVVGVWIGFGVGMDKQYFLIRKDGDQLFGLACGRCDNPYTFGALENFRIEGDTLRFEIIHQDWGERKIPFDRLVSVKIAMNEMRMDARRSDEPDKPGIIASLIGPIAIEATKGNVVGK